MIKEGYINSNDIDELNIKLSFIQKTDSQSFDINQKYSKWKLVFSQPKGQFSVWKLNGKVVKPKAIGDTEVVELKGLKNSLVLIK